MAFAESSEERASRVEPEAASLRQTVGLLTSLPEVSPPSDLRQRIEAGLAQTRGLRPMNCARVGEAVDPYLEGELSRADERALHLHLAGCRACRREVEQARAALRLTSGLAEVAPPVRVRERVAAEMAARAPERRRLRPAMRRILVSVVPLAAAAALVLAVRTHEPVALAPTAPVATAPTVAPEQAAEPSAAAEVPAAKPAAPTAVTVAKKPVPVVTRTASKVHEVMARIGESLAPAAAVAAGDETVVEEPAAPAAEAVSPEPADEPGLVGSPPSYLEHEEMMGPEERLYDMLARLSVEEITPTPAPTSPEPEADEAEASRLRLNVRGAAAMTAPEPVRRTLDVARAPTVWPKTIRIGRNQPRSVEVPLVRTEY